MSAHLISRLQSIHILIVDDDEMIRLLIRDMLRAMGFSAFEQARNGEDALRKLQIKSFDLLITDWRMSPMDGIALTRHIRTDPGFSDPTLPILMLTGMAETQDILEARDAGVTEYLAKPFTAKALGARLEAIADRPRAFVLADEFMGPDRRRKQDKPAIAQERRDEANSIYE